MDAAARSRQARTRLTASQRHVDLGAVGSCSFPEWLTVGALVVDTETGRRGEVQEWPYPVSSAPTRVWLRPAGGGREWTPRIADLRPARAEGQS